MPKGGFDKATEFRFTRREGLLLAGSAAIIGNLPLAAQIPGRKHVREISIEDAIGFGWIGNPLTPSFGDLWDRLPAISPDGGIAAFVVERGSIELGANIGTLFCIDLKERSQLKPRPIAEFSSSGRQRPISLLRWMMNSQDLLFVGTAGQESAQVFKVNVNSLSIQKMTAHQGDLLGYEVSGDGSSIFVSRQERLRPAYQQSGRVGYRIPPGGSISDEVLRYSPSVITIRAYDNRSGSSRVIPSPNGVVPGVVASLGLQGGVSWDGRWGLRKAAFDTLPLWWNEVRDGDGKAPRSQGIGWLLVDLQEGATEILRTGPISQIGQSIDPIWIDEGSAVLLVGVDEVVEGAHRRDRQGQSPRAAVVLFQPSSGSVRTVAYLPDDIVRIRSVNYSQEEGLLVIEHGARSLLNPVTLVLRRQATRWTVADRGPKPASADVQVVVEESLNVPPVLVVQEKGRPKRKLLDPNPWLEKRRLGRVEHITWKATDGRDWIGGLYYPTDYVAERQYPLVIQSYIYEPSKFRMDGGLKGQAARPLAASGVMVLQLRGLTSVGWDGELEAGALGFEGAIDFLANRGLIDRQKVGVVGFSGSGPWVGHLLAFSRYDIAAAALTDSGFGGWFYYIYNGAQSHIENQNGANPFSNMQPWLERSISFNIDRFRTPLLLIANNEGPIAVTEPFTALSRLKKPVELWNIPNSTHDLYKVKDRLLGNYLYVDWFRFWLQSTERDAPAAVNDESVETLRAQYQRWRSLKQLHLEDLEKPRPPRLTWKSVPIPD